MNINNEGDSEALYTFLDENPKTKIVGVDDLYEPKRGQFSIFSEDEPEVYCSHETKRLIGTLREVREVGMLDTNP